MAIMKFRPSSAFAPFTPLSNIEALPNRLRKMFDDLYGMEPGLSQTIGVVPPAEIIESKDELMLSLELPGMAKKDVEISVDEGILTIKGEKVETRKEGDEERKYHLWERTYGSFARSFTLPSTVDVNRIEAEFQNGVLMVRLPKTAEAKAKGRKIEVMEK